MKKQVLLMITFVLCGVFAAWAQNNDKISYQAVVRDSENRLVYNTELQVTVSLANSATGAAVYSERHTVTSNTNGLISLLIGDGQDRQGNWGDVRWNTAWVTATVRSADGQTQIAEHHLPLSAVPYALYSDYADSVNLNVMQNYLDEHHYVTEDELPAAQVNSDWTESNPDTASFIKHKPDLSVYATKDTLGYYTTTKKIDTLLGDYAKTQDLLNYVLKENLCTDVISCISDTLNAYYDSTQVKTAIHDTASALRALMGDAANDGLLMIVAAGDTTRFTANQATNDTVRLNQFATKDTLANFATTEDLANYEPREELCGDVKNCIKDTLGEYTTTNQVDTLLGAYYDTTYVNQTLKQYLKTGDLCDSVVKCEVIKDMRDSIKDNATAIQNINTSITTLQNADAALSNRINDDSLKLVQFKEKMQSDSNTLATRIYNDSLTLAHRMDTVYRHLCDSVMSCSGIQTMQTNIANNTNNIGTNMQAIIDSSAHIRNEIKYGQITIALNRGTETGVTNPTFGLNQADTQTVTINIPEAATVNNGQLTIVAAGDTTRFKANQASNDTVRLNKFATKDTLDQFVNKLAIRDSVNNIVKDSIAEPNSAINQAIDTIARHNIHDTAVAIRNSIGNGMLTIKQGAVTLGTFTANQTEPSEITIQTQTVPTKISDLENDSRFADTTADNHFTGNNNFTGTNTVPNGYVIKGDNPTNGTNCGNIVVNACDLWAVFDSLTKRMDQMQETIKGLRDSLQNVMPKLSIVANPTAGIICGDNPATIAYTANITNGNIADYQLKWTVNGTDSTTVTGPTLTCNFTTNGEQKVVCTATSSEHLTMKDSATINVTTGVVPDFSTTITYLTVSLNSESDIDSIAWGDGTGEKNPSSFPVPHNYSNSGIVTITVYSTTGCTAETDVKLIAPCTGFSSYNNNEVATGEAGNYTITAVKDVQNHQYKVVQLGSQCWMAQNLRSTQYSISGEVPTLELFPTSGYTSGAAYYAYPNSDSQNEELYGLLYNWKAAMGGSSDENAQGICPDGWHVPSHSEFVAMINATASQYAAGKLAGSSLDTWELSEESAVPGNYNYREHNVSGFSAMPAGRHDIYSPNQEFRQSAFIWSSTEINANDNAYALILSYNMADAIIPPGYQQTSCLSVRCVRDVPIVTTSAATGITTNSATLNGSVDANGFTIAEKGFVYVKEGEGESEYDTVSVPVNGDLTYQVTNLEAGTYYYFKAYAVANGTYYVGSWKSFKTKTPFVCGESTVKDADNNTYNTVQIGEGDNVQCWMAENLRSITYDGTTSITGYYSPNNDNSPSNIAQYGYLYNWAAVMRGSNIEGSRGICPEGWHVPTEADFAMIIITPEFNSYFGNQLAGKHSVWGYNNFDSKVFYWTSEIEENEYKCLEKSTQVVYFTLYEKEDDPAFSVRCVRDTQ